MTNLKPDLFLYKASKEVVFFELTCPWDSNIQRRHAFKEKKYAPLIADLSRNYKVYNNSVEISARGQVSKQNHAQLPTMVFRCVLASL